MRRVWETVGALGGWRDPRPWLAVVLAGAIGVNALFFSVIERTTPPSRAKAFDRSASSDLLALTLTNPTSRTRWDMYMAMGFLSPGSTLTVAADAEDYLPHYRFYAMSMGQARDVVLDDRPSAALWGPGPSAGVVVAAGEGGSGNAPWEMVVPEADAPQGEIADPTRFVAQEVKDGAPFPSGPSRDWVLVRFPDDNPKWGYRVVLIDASLIGVQG